MLDNPMRSFLLSPSLQFPPGGTVLQGDVYGLSRSRCEVLYDLGDGVGCSAELTGCPGTVASFPVEQGWALP